MAILGIGVDLVEISRIGHLCQSYPQFGARCFTMTEQEECFAPAPNIPRIAGRFAVKEAVSKALGTGIGKVRFCEIETVCGAHGQPVVQLHGEAKAVAAQLGVRDIHCSISHERTMAVAMILLEG